MALACFLTYLLVRTMVMSFVRGVNDIQIEGQPASGARAMGTRLCGYRGGERHLRRKNFQDISGGYQHGAELMSGNGTLRNVTTRPMPCASLARLRHGASLWRARWPKPTTSTPWPWPRSWACARL